MVRLRMVRLPMVRLTIPLLLCVILFTFQGASSQQPSAPSLNLPSADNPDQPSGMQKDAQKELEKKANLQRQADLKRDTDKLLKLSNELKDYVDKSNENVLSLDVVKKAEEIEKLAHNVKLRMKGEK
jgi:hypothetical protein